MKRSRLFISAVTFACSVWFSSLAAFGARPEIINVSAFDPKEKQRAGASYSPDDLSAFRLSGARGVIARAGKGGNLDEKCARFLAAADRERMLVGVYYRMQTRRDAAVQADQFVSRAQAIVRSRSWSTPTLLLCADFDADSSLSDMLRFMDRVESRTGVVPVAYLENSQHLKQILSGADAATQAKLRRMPYWLALYSHESGAGPVYPAPGNPENLVKQYGLWKDWTLWQYGGVDFERGRSQPKVYRHGVNQFPIYFGNLDRPVERNVFNGTVDELRAFWQEHGLKLK